VEVLEKNVEKLKHDLAENEQKLVQANEKIKRKEEVEINCDLIF